MTSLGDDPPFQPPPNLLCPACHLTKTRCFPCGRDRMATRGRTSDWRKGKTQSIPTTDWWRMCGDFCNARACGLVSATACSGTRASAQQPRCGGVARIFLCPACRLTKGQCLPGAWLAFKKREIEMLLLKRRVLHVRGRLSKNVIEAPRS